MFCKHDWKVLSETLTKSQFEDALEVTKKAGLESVTIPGHLCDGDRKHIQVFTCAKCGKFKRFVENI